MVVRGGTARALMLGAEARPCKAGPGPGVLSFDLKLKTLQWGAAGDFQQGEARLLCPKRTEVAGGDRRRTPASRLGSEPWGSQIVRMLSWPWGLKTGPLCPDPLPPQESGLHGESQVQTRPTEHQGASRHRVGLGLGEDRKPWFGSPGLPPVSTRPLGVVSLVAESGFPGS